MDMYQFTSVDADGNQNVRVITKEAIASWGELLGLTQPSEIVSAIIYIQENGEPEPDPVTGETPWATAYRALGAREFAKKEELARANLEGTATDPRSPKLRSLYAGLAMKEEVVAAQEETRRALFPDSIKNVVPMFPLTASALKEDKDKFLEYLNTLPPQVTNQNDSSSGGTQP